MKYFSDFDRHSIDIEDKHIKALKGAIKDGKLMALYQILERERLKAALKVKDIGENVERIRYNQGILRMWEVIVGELTYIDSEGFDRLKMVMEEREKEIEKMSDEYEEEEGVMYEDFV